MTLAGKHIWLVGGSEGIGAALAASLSQQGAHVAISARNEAAMAAIPFHPVHPFVLLPLDVTSPSSIASAWEKLLKTWPTLDMVIYNAGAYEPMEAANFDLEKIERMVDVNFHGALRILAHVLPYFIANNKGHIALVGSVAGYRGLPASLGYGASKAAIIHLAENLKADLARTPITVQLFSPGFVKTRLTDKNNFTMPCIISPEKAAVYMIRGLQSRRFETHFPKRFSTVLKLLSLLPASLYFALLRCIKL